MKAMSEQMEERVAISGLGAFVRLDATVAPRAWKKEVLRVWEGTDPTTGRKLRFTREDLVRIADRTNRWIALGHKVYAPDGHTDAADANRGWWSRFWVEAETLFGQFDPATDAIALAIGSSIRDVSIFMGPVIDATTGELFEDVLLHVCLTPAPVLPGQANFVRLARKESPMTVTKLAAGDAGTPPAADAGGAPAGMNAKDAIKFLALLFGLAPTASPDDVVAAARDCLMDEGGEDDAAAMAAPSAAPTLMARADARAKKVEAKVRAELGGKITALEELEKKRRAAYANEVVLLARKDSAEAGVLLGEDETKQITTLLSSGNEQLEAAGKSMLASHRARIEDARKLRGTIALSRAEGSPESPEGKALAERKAKHDAEVAGRLEAIGVRPAKKS